MRNLVFFLVSACFFFNPLNANAQLGWKWGVSSQSSFYEQAGLMATDKEGNIFVSGYNNNDDSTRFGSITVYNPQGLNQVLISKLDSSGNFLWALGTQNSNAYPIGLGSDGDGNVYMLGYYDSNICVIGPDTLFNTPHIAITANAYLMTFLAKITPSGSVAWVKNVTRYIGFGGSMSIENNGNIYVSGSIDNDTADIGTDTVYNTNMTRQTFNIYLAKFDSSGNTLWAKNFGGSALGNLVSVAGNGTVYLCGGFMDTLVFGSHRLIDNNFSGIIGVAPMPWYLTALDSNGNPLWTEDITKQLRPWGMTADAAGNIYMTGNIDTNAALAGTTINTLGNFYMFTAKFGPTGALKWIKPVIGGASGPNYQVALDNCGNVWVAGNFGGGLPNTVDFGGGITLTNPPGIATDPMFIAEYDSSGHYITNAALPSGGDDYVGIVADNLGNVYLGSDYFNDQVMVIGPDTLNGNFTLENLFVAKYRYTFEICLPDTLSDTIVIHKNGIPVTPYVTQVNIYPNPASGELIVQSDIPFLPGAIAQITDITGRMVQTATLSGATCTLNVGSLSPGVYECRVISGELNLVKKVVIMK